MALSDHEQRVLDEIEQQLLADDPVFASNVAKVRTAKLRQRRPVLSGSIFLLGLVFLVLGVIVSQSQFVLGIVISVAGFLAMVGGSALFAIGIPREQTRPTPTTPTKPSSGLAGRMEDRLRRRLDG